MSASDDSARRLPPLNSLKAFEAAARRLSISLAARELGVTPGAVSQQIKVLEDHAGAPLFRRDGGAVALTELGARLQPVLRDAFEQLKRAADIVYGPTGRRSLAVSVPPSFAARWLAPRMVRFSAEHPEIEVWVSADMQLADVAGGRADVAVRYGVGDYPGVRSELLLDAGVIPVCSPALLSGRNPLRKPADLANHTLIHVGHGRVEEPRPDWAAWLKARGVSGVDLELRRERDALAARVGVLEGRQSRRRRLRRLPLRPDRLRHRGRRQRPGRGTRPPRLRRRRPRLGPPRRPLRRRLSADRSGLSRRDPS